MRKERIHWVEIFNFYSKKNISQFPVFYVIYVFQNLIPDFSSVIKK